MTDIATAPTTLTIRRTFNAPRERVFAAFTEAEIIALWMGGDGCTTHSATFEARTGGAFRISMSTPGGDMVAKGIVTAIRPVEHLAYTWTWEEDDAADENVSAISIDFIERGATTEMIFVHERLASEASRDRHIDGWNASFDKVAALL
jgi:uncharacterized protein YndB with AHSA1/START domain